MATHSLKPAQTHIHPELGDKRPGSLLGYYIYCEMVKTLRIPAFIIPSLLFPSLFFIMFGLPNINMRIGDLNAGAYMMVSFGSYMTLFIGLISFCTSMANERSQGWNKLLKVTPLPFSVYFLAKMITTLVVGLLSMVLLFALAIIAGHIQIAPLTILTLLATLLAGTIPFILLGFAIGYTASPSAAGTIANLIYMPLSFASGLLVPLPSLPAFVRTIAPYLPSYQVGQLGRSVIGAADTTTIFVHIAWLLGYTLIFGILASYAYYKDKSRNFS